ncbi:DNA-processing protein DprA [Salinispira pacifica]
MADHLLALAVHALETLHTREKLKLISEAGTAMNFARFSRLDVEKCIGRSLRSRAVEPSRLLRAAENDLKYLTQTGIAYTFYWNDGFPPLLREIYDPPLVLFHRGAFPDPENPLLAIVGTRRPTGTGLRAAFSLGREAAAAGLPVVSGLARGIDAAAHQGALSGRGKTVAILGSGVDCVYPVSNRRLAEALLAEGGCIASEYAPGTPPLRHHFPARNRIIAGLCRGTVVVEAPPGSGALITSDFCLEQGRDLFVHRAGCSGVNGGGCGALAEEGAVVIETAEDVLSEWGRPRIERSSDPSQLKAGFVEGSLQFPLDLGEAEPAARADVQTGSAESRKAGRTAAALLSRELDGEIERQFGVFFRSDD